MLVFVEGRKPENPARGEPTTNSEFNTGLISGRCRSCFPEERERGDCTL